MNFLTKEQTSIEERKKQAEAIRMKYPDRIPVIVERVPGSQISDIGNRKFLVPNDISMGQFMWIIRKRIQLSSKAGLYVFINQTRSGTLKFMDNFKQSWTIPPSTSTMGQIYTEHKEADGFLYIAYTDEDRFGY
jgi:GABA(A) receptor-associated protein